MATKKTKNRPLSYTPSEQLPKLGYVRETWDLEKHFYKSERDLRIEKDVAATERAYAAFEKKYRGKDFTSTAAKLARALKEYEELGARPEAARPLRYFSFRRELNSADSVAEKKLNLISDRLRDAGNKLLFFELAIGKIPVKTQRAYLKDPLLAPYRYTLKNIFEEAKHTLTEAEERILSLRANTSFGMWVDATEKIISNRTVNWKGKTLALPEAIEQIESQKPGEKPKLWSKVTTELAGIAEVAENEFTAITTHKKVSDELRSYPEPYSATIQSYENDEASVLALVDAISTKGFALSKKFYNLKAKLHGTAALPYPNKYDSIGIAPAVPFDEAVTICRDVFYKINNEYGKIFDRLLTNGQTDVYPKRGKRGGAFMSGDVNQPTLVFLNHTDTVKALETLAHEMGHAVHQERSKEQPARYQGYSTATAETASTLFEQFVFDALFEAAPERDKPVLLHDRLTRDIATIQRQITFFNFELELHRHVRREGAITKEELRDMMQKHLRAYLGKGVDVTPEDGWSYVYVPHFRYGFYVYTYTYGALASNIMAARLREDESYQTEIDRFLTAGGSDTVENIFQSIGINTRKVETFTESLTSLERDIATFEKFAKRR